MPAESGAADYQKRLQANGGKLRKQFACLSYYSLSVTEQASRLATDDYGSTIAGVRDLISSRQVLLSSEQFLDGYQCISDIQNTYGITFASVFRLMVSAYTSIGVIISIVFSLNTE